MKHKTLLTIKRNVVDFQRLYRHRFLKRSRSERRFSEVRFENVEVRNLVIRVLLSKIGVDATERGLRKGPKTGTLEKAPMVIPDYQRKRVCGEAALLLPRMGPDKCSPAALRARPGKPGWRPPLPARLCSAASSAAARSREPALQQLSGVRRTRCIRARTQ